MLLKIYSKLKSILLYSWQFKKFELSSRIDLPLRIDGKKNIEIGSKCLIQHRTWLGALPLTCEDVILKIGNNVCLGNYNHVYATRSIIIEDNVLTADKVYISDNVHGYENVNIPIKRQRIKQLNNVIIGKNSWLGENVCVIGASIGKHCVIGANSVVTKDIPDYSVAVGAPAKVIKQYDFTKKQWVAIT